MAVTAKEIAKKLNISAAAVSMVLNNKPGISDETRELVLNTAREMGYNLAKKQSRPDEPKGTICFINYKTTGAVVNDTPFFSLLTEGITNTCRENKYDLIIKYLYEEHDMSTQLQAINASKFAGIVLLATEMTERSLECFKSVNCPLVILDSYFESSNHSCVVINNIQGAFLATNYLIKQRKKQPGYLRSNYPITNFDERADGFYKALRQNNLSPSDSLVHFLTPSEEGAYYDMKRIINSGIKLADSYFADNDHIAVGAGKALFEAGYKVPEDVAIVGFDDLPLSAFINPPLTTVNVPKSFMGAAAAEIVIGEIEHGFRNPIKVAIKTTLSIRNSV